MKPGNGTGLAQRSRYGLAVLTLLVSVVFVYGQVLGHEFVSFDDSIYITKNRSIQDGLTSDSVAWAFRTPRAANWHPLTWLSHALDVELFGLEAGGHHAVNAVLHAINAVLLFAFFAWATRAFWPSFLVALLFAVHPLRVESVAWVSERKDLLGGLFWILAMLAYAGYARRPSWPRHVAVSLLLVLGLMAKPMLVTLPCVFLLLDVWPLERLRAGGASVLRLVLEKLPWFLLSAASCWVTVIVQAKGGAVSTIEEIPFAYRLRNSIESAVDYIGATFWPRGLSYFYPHPRIEAGGWEIWGVGYLVSILVLVVLTALAVVTFRKRRFFAVGWFWFLGTLVPVIGLVQVGMQARADRYVYLPGIGLLIALVFGGRSWARGRAGVTLATAGFAACLPLAWLARARTADWKDSLTLYSRAIEVNGENYVAYEHLGVEYAERGDFPMAERNLRRSLELKGSNVNARTALANALVRSGKPQEAARHYQAALRLNPDLPLALNGAGHALIAIGDLEQAEPLLLRCIAVQPAYFEAHSNLGMLYGRSGRLAEAERHLLRAVELRPESAGVRNNLGSLYARRGNFLRAREEFTAALELAPDYVDARWSLGLCWIELGKPERAAVEFERVLSQSRAPSSARRDASFVPTSLADLALALHAQGKERAADQWARRALELSPPGQEGALGERLAEVLSGT